VCPNCGRAYPGGSEERFCANCGMPLVIADEAGDAAVGAAPSEARERARKIKPEFARGDLVRVAGGRNLAEAELIQNLLLEEGVPSLLRRSAGFDVPDFLAAGPRDVLVPETGAEVARDLLQSVDMAPQAGAMERPNPLKLLLVFLGIAAITTLICWGLIALAG
jgi:hypothetical protein